MTDSKVETTVTGGQVQGLAGAGTVIIENFTIYNRSGEVQAKAKAKEASDAIPPCPYPGLAYFGPAEAPWFFGRDTAITRLGDAVRRHSLTALIGASGSGKSSVVLAGLAPRLHSTGDWRFSHFRIGTELDRNPFLALARALVPLFVESDSETNRLKNTRQLAVSLETGELTLFDVFADFRSRNKGTRVLLIADQFEEAFTLIDKEAVLNRFIDVLITGFKDISCHSTPKICLILTLRGDFYGRALRFRPLADALQDHIENLGPMSREELQCAINRPAEKYHRAFEPGLVEALLDNVENRPGSLPLLQFALREMWGHQTRRKLTWKSYDDIGGVEGALARRAEAIFGALTADVETATSFERGFQRLFTRLVMLGEGQEDTRRVVERRELGDTAWSLAQRLADEDNRLIVTNTSVLGRETAEVVHEALIRHWPRLVDWIDRDRAFQLWLRQIRSNVDIWMTNQSDDAPLLRGSLLSQAMDWLSARRDDLSGGEQLFIEASFRLHERQRSERLLLDGLMRSLELPDLADQVKVDLARKEKLRDFIAISSASKSYSWRTVATLYGEALGLDNETVLGQIADRRKPDQEAVPRISTIPDVPYTPARYPDLRDIIVIASIQVRNMKFVGDGGSIFGHLFNTALEGAAADAGGTVTVRGTVEHIKSKLAVLELNQMPVIHPESLGTLRDFPLTVQPPAKLQTFGKRRAILAASDSVEDRGIAAMPGGEALMNRTGNILSDCGSFEVSMLLGKQMTRLRFIEELYRVTNEVSQSDCLLFYFSGAAQFDKDRSTHLVFADSTRVAPQTLDFHAVANLLKQSKSKSVIAILDVSFSSAAFGTRGALPGIMSG